MIKKILVTVSNRYTFFILVIGAYIYYAIVDGNVFNDALAAFLDLGKKMIPVLLAVFFLMFIFNVLIQSKRIVKLLGTARGVKSYLLAIIFGIVSAGPIYMWYPLLSDLREHGVKDSLLVTFLYNRAVKLPLLPLMIYYFGLKFVIILTVLMILFSVINGVVVQYLLTPSK